MTQKTQQELDTYEAKVQRAISTVRKVGEDVYEVPSESEPGLRHILTVVNGKVTWCSRCKGHQFWHRCYHQIAVERYIAAQEAVAEAEAYVKMRDGGIVLASAQIRTREPREFSLYR